MSSRRIFRTPTGRQLTIGKQLGKGGEGVVHEVDGEPSIAVKLYHPNIARERAEKITAMVAAQWHAAASNVAFPIETLFSPSGQFAGFTMRRVGGHKPIHSLYSPTSRKTEFPAASFRFLIRTGLNIARALASVNATGCVVGDINHSGILVSNDATVTLIDCDSFQASAGGKTFYCKVGVPEFTPPELQGKRFDQTIRTVNHDSFGLAVLLFNLLFMGRHPFAGKYLGSGDMPMETAIAQYRFAYSTRKNETRMEPPPNVPVLMDIPRALGDALEVAFGQIGVTKGRKTASDWVRLLEVAERDEIVQCSSKKEHQYFRAASACPWCAMENAYPGFLAFSPPLFSGARAPVDLGQLIAAIRAIPDPGMASELRATMPALTGTPSPTPTTITSDWTRRYLGGVLISLCAIELFHLKSPAPIFGALILGGGAWVSLKAPLAVQPFQKIVTQATSAFNGLETKWKVFSDNRQFVEYRREAESSIQQFLSLSSEEASGLSSLKIKLRDAQLTRFLERFYIDHAKIKGIGNARKVTLRSYGIETAADVQRHRIENVNGFGPAIAGALIGWRTSIERKFVFDPKQPINPADIAAVKAAIAKRRNDLQAAMRQWLAKLRTASDQTLQSRSNLRAAAMPVWNALKKAELDEAAFKGQVSTVAQKWAFAIVIAIGFVAINALNTDPKVETRASGAVKKVENQILDSAPPVTGSSPTAWTNLPTAEHAATKPVARYDFAPPAEPGGFTPQRSPLFGNTTSPSGESVAPEPFSNPPLDLNPKKDRDVADTRILPLEPWRAEAKSLLIRENVLAVQSRLEELGFISGKSAGAWNAASRDALRNFKTVNNLTRDDVWDFQTEKALAAITAIRADQSFVGTWSESRRCDPDPKLESSIVIDARRARSASGVCEFLSVAPDGLGWRTQSKCTVSGRTWSAPITFTVNSGKLVWSGREVTTYFRCR
jgi:DNA-binding helix-hairpin-helix protein with protein kinase domain